MSNREWIFAKRPAPEGMAESDFKLQDCERPTAGDGELLLATHLISIDPTMRNAMGGSDVADRTDGSAYFKAMSWTPGAVIGWSAISRVEESKDPGFQPGDFVECGIPLREFNVVKAERCKKLPEGVPPTAYMSAMGGTAKTAYLSVRHIGEPKAGEVAFVSGAAGATGLLACQTLKNFGCRVIGSAGTDDKTALLESLGVEAFNYKKESTMEGLRRLAPEGLNIYYDNVGGETLEQTIEMMNDFGRIIMCGAISQYDKRPAERYGVKNLFHVVAKQLKLQGFIVTSFKPEQFAEANEDLAKWIREGTVQDRHTALEGFDQFPAAIMGLFAGRNTGKMLVSVPLQPL